MLRWAAIRSLDCARRRSQSQRTAAGLSRVPFPSEQLSRCPKRGSGFFMHPSEQGSHCPDRRRLVWHGLNMIIDSSTAYTFVRFFPYAPCCRVRNLNVHSGKRQAMEQRKEQLISDIRSLYRKLPMSRLGESNEHKHAQFVLESVLAMKTAELKSLGSCWH